MLRGRAVSSLGLGLCLSLASGCATEGSSLTVRVTTGLRAGDEISSLDAVLSLGADCARTGQSISRDLSTSDQGPLAAGTFALPVYTGLARGVYSLLVTARGPTTSGLAERASRCVVFPVSANRVLDVPLTVACDGVVCPGPGGSRGFTECLNGRCVAPTCVPGDPATLEDCCDRARLGAECDITPTLCSAPTDCVPTVACALAPACVEGACIEPLGDVCAAEDYCDTRSGACVPRSAPPDASGLDAGPARDVGSDDDASRDASPPNDSSRDVGPLVTGEDCVRIGDEDLDRLADCDDPECAPRAICAPGCAPRAAIRIPGVGIMTPTHWYRVDLSAVRTTERRVCALDDLVGGRPLLADPMTMPLLGTVGVGSLDAVVLDSTALLRARASDLSVDRDGDYSLFVVVEDTPGSGSYRPFTAGTYVEGAGFDLVSLRLHHALDVPGARTLIAHGSSFAAGEGIDGGPHVVAVLAASTRPGDTTASRLELRFDGTTIPLVVSLGDGAVSGRAVVGEPWVEIVGAFGGAAPKLAEILVYDRRLGEAEILAVEAYLTERYLR